MADLDNLIKGLSGIAGIFSGALMTAQGANQQAAIIQQGGEAAAQGQLLTAAGLRQSAISVGAANQFNIKVDAINEQRRLAATSRQMQRMLGTQLTQQVKSGLSVSGKSFLLLKSETLSVFEQAILDIKVDAENKRRSMNYEAAVRQVNLENQARAAEYTAAVERVMASNRAAAAAFQGKVAMFGAGQELVKAIPTLLSQATTSSKPTLPGSDVLIVN